MDMGHKPPRLLKAYPFPRLSISPTLRFLLSFHIWFVVLISAPINMKNRRTVHPDGPTDMARPRTDGGNWEDVWLGFAYAEAKRAEAQGGILVRTRVLCDALLSLVFVPLFLGRMVRHSAGARTTRTQTHPSVGRRRNKVVGPVEAADAGRILGILQPPPYLYPESEVLRVSQVVECEATNERMGTLWRVRRQPLGGYHAWQR